MVTYEHDCLWDAPILMKYVIYPRDALYKVTTAVKSKLGWQRRDKVLTM